MRVSLVFAPSICLPNQIYHALPLLAGALRAGGHEPRQVDLNLSAADQLLTDERTQRYFQRALDEYRRHHASEAPWRSELEPLLAQAEARKELLRDPATCFLPGRFKDAFWGTVDALGVLYQFDEIVSPFRDSFVADIHDWIQRDPWTPLRDQYDEGLLDEVLAHDPGLVGITLAFPEQAAEAMRLARLVRQRRPDVAIAMGGPLFNVHPERWLESGWLFELTDYLVLGDGAQSVVALADALEGRGSLDDVRNLVRRVDGRLVRNDASPWLEPIDDLALPDFESAPMERFLTPQPIYPLMLSRGCYWGRCTFCSIGWRENYRMLRPENIERHARQLSELGARYVQLQDSSVPPRGARLLAETVARESLGLHWEGGFKFSAQLEDPEYCAALHAGGCRSLKMGLESMNQGVLDLMDKGFDVERVPTMLANLRGAGISAEMLWFIGFPTEGLEDVLRTVRFLHERRDLFGLTAFVGDYALHPDTIVFDEPQRFGVTVTGQENGYCSYEVAEGLSQAETLELKQILAGHNNRTLVCNGSHLPHLVETGLDLTDIARPPSDPQVLTEALAQR